MMGIELTIDWFGTLSGIIGVSLAVYLQLINPRDVHEGYVTAIFLAGAAVMLVFSGAWVPRGPRLMMKFAAAMLFLGAEVTAAYFIWRAGEVCSPSQAYHEIVHGECDHPT